MCDAPSNLAYPGYSLRSAQLTAVPESRPLPVASTGPVYRAPDESNLYQNIVDYTPGQRMQLNRDALMPMSWRNPVAAAAVADEPGCSDFAKHTVTPQGYQTYLSTSGSARFSLISRNPIGKLGTRNLLRIAPPVNVGDTNEITWNDSDYRRSLSQGYGCAGY